MSIKTHTTANYNDDDMPARLLDPDSSSESNNSSSSSAEEEDDRENDQNVEMRQPTEYGEQYDSNVNQRSPYMPGFQNRHNRFTT